MLSMKRLNVRITIAINLASLHMEIGFCCKPMYLSVHGEISAVNDYCKGYTNEGTNSEK